MAVLSRPLIQTELWKWHNFLSADCAAKKGGK